MIATILGIIFVGGVTLFWIIFFLLLWKEMFFSDWLKNKEKLEKIDKKYYWHVERVVKHKDGSKTYVIRIDGEKEPEKFLKKHFELGH